MRTQTVGLFSGHKMAYHEDGSGPAVVLIHGVPGSSVSMFRLGRALGALNRRVVIPDLLGFGSSSRATDTKTLWADHQADALLQTLRIARVDNAAVVGHDFGGLVALILYERAPEIFSKLILVSSNPLSAPGLPLALAPANWPIIGDYYLRYKLSTPGLKSLVQAGMGYPAVSLDWNAYFTDAKQIQATRLLLKKQWRGYGSKSARVEESLQRVKVKTHFVYGSKDPYLTATTVNTIQTSIRQCALTVLDRAGHWLPEERPRDLAELIVK